MAGHIESLPSQVKNGAWWTLASAMFMMLSAGTLYAFGAWSSALKVAYNFSQEEIELLAVCGHLGNYIVLDSGYITSRFGTVVGLTLGTSYLAVGYFCLWLAIAVYPGQFPLWLLACLCILYGHGCGTIDNAVMTQVLGDFRDYKGTVTGIVKAFYGLGTATVATAYQALFKPHEADFLICLSVYTTLAGLVLVPIFRYTKGLVDQSPATVRRKLQSVVGVMVAGAIFFFLTQTMANHLTQRWWRVILAIIALMMLGLFLLPFDAPKRRRSSKVPGDKAAEEGASPTSPTPHHHDFPRDVSGFEMLGLVDFWLFITVAMIAQGNGLMFISNAAQIPAAVMAQDMSGWRSQFVALLSVFNALARLAFGALSERLQHRVPRTWFLLVAVAILQAGYLVVYLAGGMSVWVAAGLVGFGYGGLWGVQPAIVAELFGYSDYSFKYACSAMAAAGGSVIFNELVAGPNFDLHVKGRPEYPLCYDPICFQTSFLACAVADVFAIGAAILLATRTSWIYLGPGEKVSSEEDDENTQQEAE